MFELDASIEMTALPDLFNGFPIIYLLSSNQLLHNGTGHRKNRHTAGTNDNKNDSSHDDDHDRLHSSGHLCCGGIGFIFEEVSSLIQNTVQCTRFFTDGSHC